MTSTELLGVSPSHIVCYYGTYTIISQPVGSIINSSTINNSRPDYNVTHVGSATVCDNHRARATGATGDDLVSPGPVSIRMSYYAEACHYLH